MVCGECGATIADKAIVCYRCGAPTAVPAASTRPSRPRRRGLPLVGLLLVLVSVLFGWLAVDVPPGESTRQIVYAVVAIVALALGGWVLVQKARR